MRKQKFSLTSKFCDHIQILVDICCSI